MPFSPSPFLSTYMWVMELSPLQSLRDLSHVWPQINHTAARVSSISHQLPGPSDPCRRNGSAFVVGATATSMIHVPQRGGEHNFCVLNTGAAQGRAACSQRVYNQYPSTILGFKILLRLIYLQTVFPCTSLWNPNSCA